MTDSHSPIPPFIILDYRSAGYSYYGSEPLYSGLSGKEMEVDIFIGVVYYQRLR